MTFSSEVAATIPAFAAAEGGKIPAFGVKLGAQPAVAPVAAHPFIDTWNMRPESRPSRRSWKREGFMLLLLGILIKILVVVGVTEGAVAYLIWVERKVAAYSQDRIGPNRCGMEFGIPFGLVQPLVDGAKMLLKEDVVPRYVNKPIFILAPAIAIIAATIGFAVVPFGSVGPGSADQLPDRAQRRYRHRLRLRRRQLGGLRRDSRRLGLQQQVFVSRRASLQCAAHQLRNSARDVDPRHGLAGRLARPQRDYPLAGSGPRLGHSRPADRISLVPHQRIRRNEPLAVRPPRVRTGTRRRVSHGILRDEVRHVLPRRISARDYGQLPDRRAVLRRLGRPFLLSSAQDGWFWSLVKVAVMAGKVALMIFFVMWVRWTLPRFRYDQLMDLAWKKLIPLALVNLVLTAVIVQLIRG